MVWTHETKWISKEEHEKRNGTDSLSKEYCAKIRKEIDVAHLADIDADAQHDARLTEEAKAKVHSVYEHKYNQLSSGTFK